MHWPVPLNPNGNDPKFPKKEDGSRDLVSYVSLAQDRSSCSCVTVSSGYGMDHQPDVGTDGGALRERARQGDWRFQVCPLSSSEADPFGGSGARLTPLSMRQLLRTDAGRLAQDGQGHAGGKSGAETHRSLLRWCRFGVYAEKHVLAGRIAPVPTAARADRVPRREGHRGRGVLATRLDRLAAFEGRGHQTDCRQARRQRRNYPD